MKFNKNTTDAQKQAYGLGKEAFKNGIACAPFYDRALDLLYKGVSTKEHAAISKAWSSGFMEAYHAATSDLLATN